MKNVVLFSAVGGHDPIAQNHDGAILHICRKYRPQKVYLYLSKEMVERSESDNRYAESLNLLQVHLNYHCEHIELIKRRDLTEVQLFDTFYQDFETIIYRLKKENPDCLILLNISSGTPAMKSALEIIAALSTESIVAVQVSTPGKKENPKGMDQEQYDLHEAWKCNKDNAEDFKDRCSEVESNNLVAKIKIEAVKKLIYSYDYHAALILSKEIGGYINPMAIHMLEAAVCRLQLDIAGYTTVASAYGFDFLPVKKTEVQEVFEYILSLQVKQKQGNYADFIRALSPVILDVFDLYLQKKHGINFKQEYCEKRGNAYFPRVRKMDKAQDTQLGQMIKSCLLAKKMSEERAIKKLEESFYSSWQLLKIIECVTATDTDKSVVERANRLRENVEKKIRNITAHEIVSVTENEILKRTGMGSEQIITELKELFAESGYSFEEHWDSYDKMNGVIVAKIMEISY